MRSLSLDGRSAPGPRLHLLVLSIGGLLFSGPRLPLLAPMESNHYSVLRRKNSLRLVSPTNILCALVKPYTRQYSMSPPAPVPGRRPRGRSCCDLETGWPDIFH